VIGGCSLSEHPNLSEPTGTPELEVFCAELGCMKKEMECSYDGCHCTELGCSNSLSFEFVGTIPQSYIVEVTDQQNNEIILHCFEPDQGKNYPYILEEYSLDSPSSQRITQFSPAPQMCKKNSTGHAGIYVRADGSPDMAVVSCSAWPDQQFHDFVVDSRCSRIDQFEGFRLGYPDQFLPEEISIVIQWGTFTTTVKSHPEYESYRPNGPECEPECFEAFFTIDLP
jgi:hypothetical protein